MHWLLRRHYGSYTLEEGAAPLSLTQSLDAYFAGSIDVVAGVEIATGGTPFQRRVWRALGDIPAGTTVTYRQLAGHLGENKASRAVGAANGASPIAIVVPCHQVIGANGGLTGYAAGLLRKQWLLEHEASFSRSQRVKKRRMARLPRAYDPARSTTTSCGSSAMSGEIAGSGTDFPCIDAHARMVMGLEIGRQHFGITGPLNEAENQERTALAGLRVLLLGVSPCTCARPHLGFQREDRPGLQSDNAFGIVHVCTD